MPQVPQSEIQPGLVVHLDTDELRRIGGSQTNAEVATTGDRAVRGPHYFLVLESTHGMRTAVPLFTRKTPGAEKLVEGKKSGLPDKWIGQDSHFNRYQHWKIPLAAVEASSGTEESDSSNRRRYAPAEPATLAEILAWQAKNRAAYRAA